MHTKCSEPIVAYDLVYQSNLFHIVLNLEHTHQQSTYSWTWIIRFIYSVLKLGCTWNEWNQCSNCAFTLLSAEESRNSGKPKQEIDTNRTGSHYASSQVYWPPKCNEKRKKTRKCGEHVCARRWASARMRLQSGHLILCGVSFSMSEREKRENAHFWSKIIMRQPLNWIEFSATGRTCCNSISKNSEVSKNGNLFRAHGTQVSNWRQKKVNKAKSWVGQMRECKEHGRERKK